MFQKCRPKHLKLSLQNFTVFCVWIIRSFLGPILFNIFISDLLLWVKNAELHNFDDGNNISCTEKSLEELSKILTSESEKAVQWFKENMMIVNHDKFQAIIVDRKNKKITPPL